MPRIAVLGGTGYLASLIKNKNCVKKNKFFFFSRKKNAKNHLNILFDKKNISILKKFDYIVHLIGPNQNQLLNNKNLIEKKNKLTAKICDLCLINNIKLIYISSMQVYEDYGKKNISLNSKINIKNFYSKTHYESEKIILKKFLSHKDMFIILRMGNVFGFKKYENFNYIKNNLIHSICFLGLKKNKIVINNGSIQRTYVPSKIFVNLINNIIQKNFTKNNIINISYKNFFLKEIANIIKERIEILFNTKIDLIIKKFKYEKKFKILDKKKIKFKNIDKCFYTEIDTILKKIKKII